MQICMAIMVISTITPKTTLMRILPNAGTSLFTGILCKNYV